MFPKGPNVTLFGSGDAITLPRKASLSLFILMWSEKGGREGKERGWIGEGKGAA